MSGAVQPLKVALVLSDGVALGSFEAGVGCELLSALARGAPLTVDIVAGSSAGALVGSVITRVLTTGVAFTDLLYRWTDTTLHELTTGYETLREARARAKPVDTGILSSQALRRILEWHLVEDFGERSFQPVYPAPRVAFTVSLSNLDGLPGSDPQAGEIRFDEAVTFRFTLPDPHCLARSDYSPEVWARIARVVQASAAFPGAFDPEAISWADRFRRPGWLEETWGNDSWLRQLHKRDPALQPQMRYADGGILDGQPVEQAVATLPQVTGGVGEAGLETLVYDPRRTVVFVEPDPPATPLETLQAELSHSWIQTFDRAFQLWSFSTSAHKGHRQVEESNHRLERLFSFLALLARRVYAGETTPTAAQALCQFQAVYPEVDGLSRLGADGAAGLIDPDLYREGVVEFYRWLTDHQRFRRDMQWLELLPSPSLRSAHRRVGGILHELRQAYLDLQRAGSFGQGIHPEWLHDIHCSLAESLGLCQPWVALYQVTPEAPKQMLKGEGLGHFGGFLSREFLHHDFQVGRYCADLWLRDMVPEHVRKRPLSPPPIDDDERLMGLLWQNRGPLLRMTGRVLGGILETAGLARPGFGVPTLRLLGWCLMFSMAHGAALLAVMGGGVVVFPAQYRPFRYWLVAGACLFPVVCLAVWTLGLALEWFRHRFRRRGSMFLR